MAFGEGISSFMNRERPQENQTLQGNPISDPNAQTSWMDDSSSSDSGGWASPSENTGQQQGGGSVLGNGTALSAVAQGGGSWNGTGNSGISGFGGGMSSSYMNPQQGQQQNTSSGGNVGQYMPEGYDTGKFSDTAGANSTKYQVGRILSKYPPGQAGLQQAAAELSQLGISVQGRDKIRLPDGTTTDVGKAFSGGDPNQMKWQYNWSGPGGDDSGGSNPMQSYMGGGQGQMGMGNSMMGQQMNQKNQQQQQLMNQLMFQISQQNKGNRFQQIGGGQGLPEHQMMGVGSGQGGSWF